MCLRAEWSVMGMAFGWVACVGGSTARQRSRRNAIDSAAATFTFTVTVAVAATGNFNWQHRKWVNENRIRIKRSCVWREINNKWQQQQGTNNNNNHNRTNNTKQTSDNAKCN